MATVNSEGMLEPDMLNEIDKWILDYLAAHEHATPNLLRVMHGVDTGDRKSRQWISDRVRRLEEHGHLGKVHPDAAERELLDDPRDDDSDNQEPVNDGGENGFVSDESGSWHPDAETAIDEEAPD